MIFLSTKLCTYREMWRREESFVVCILYCTPYTLCLCSFRSAGTWTRYSYSTLTLSKSDKFIVNSFICAWLYSPIFTVFQCHPFHFFFGCFFCMWPMEKRLCSSSIYKLNSRHLFNWCSRSSFLTLVHYYKSSFVVILLVCFCFRKRFFLFSQKFWVGNWISLSHFYIYIYLETSTQLTKSLQILKKKLIQSY